MLKQVVLLFYEGSNSISNGVGKMIQSLASVFYASVNSFSPLWRTISNDHNDYRHDSYDDGNGEPGWCRSASSSEGEGSARWAVAARIVQLNWRVVNVAVAVQALRVGKAGNDGVRLDESSESRVVESSFIIHQPHVA
jgi:hypothetical protein